MVCGACTDSVCQALFTAYAKEPGDVATEVFVIPTLTQLVSLTEVFVLFRLCLGSLCCMDLALRLSHIITATKLI